MHWLCWVFDHRVRQGTCGRCLTVCRRKGHKTVLVPGEPVVRCVRCLTRWFNRW